MLWVDKHRPSKLKDLSYHAVVSDRLAHLAASPGTMPHLFFYGPSGSGKKTRVMVLLRELFGPGAERLRLDKRTFTTPAKKEIEVHMICSNYHVELSPGDAGVNDRYVVQEVIKEMASNKSLTKSDFKVVVLREVDKLSRQAQAALRRTMEKYASSCRLILCCNSNAKVMDPVRSRCLGVRIASPTHDEICTVLENIAREEKVTLPDELAVNIARESNRNLRRAILMLEACHAQRRDGGSGGMTKDQPVLKTDWELYIAQLATDITSEQSPQRLMAAREKLHELLINCIPASTIIKTLAVLLMKNLDDSLKHDVMEAAAFYEHRIAMGSKEIFHLEAFIAKYMSIYKTYLNEMFG